jgi:group I intron endonuclease
MININSKVPIIGIYKITSPSGKVYIGQSINVQKRFKLNYKALNGNIQKQPKLYNSLNKYGWENHHKEIVEKCNISELNEREIYWKQHYINQLGWDKMLFCELYDKGGGPKSEETRKKLSLANSKPKPIGFGEKMSKINKGRKCSESTKKIISAKITGTKRSEDTKNKLRKPKTKEHIQKMNRPRYVIIQYDLQDNFIQEWSSVNEIIQHLKINYRNITAACRKEQKTAGGYKWKYK